MEQVKYSVDQLINEDNKFLEEKYVKAYYNAEMNLIGIVWEGIFNKDQYMKLFDDVLDYARSHKTVGVYTDIRKQGVVPVEARKYFEKVIAPESGRMGIEKTGVVSDASPFKKYYLNTLIKVVGRPAKICNEPQDAIDYLMS
ncbi:hypothetical protein [Fulvivirga lutea]|uniref:Uncharacterized protein n=1 Tax=Fulvivirga lutea TaxID=2810512 RepID=A0A974WG35_9BACT|nr:hypothetical protein [Fulvivirga lutea]QSE97859.1 hypothetical protein JR347_01875 [Fulvivirga lutea]